MMRHKDEKEFMFDGEHFCVREKREGPFTTYRIYDKQAEAEIEIPYFHAAAANRSARRREKERTRELGS
jgi:hypothetical protein